MAAVWYVFEVRSGGVLTPGLAPAWVQLKQLIAPATFTPVGSPPIIHEVGGGQYAFQYDPEAGGEAAGIIDATSAVAAASERYFTVLLTLDSSRIKAGISATGTVVVGSNQDKTGTILAPTGLDPVLLPGGHNVPVLTAIRRIAAATCGTTTGVGTGSVTYADMGLSSSTNNVLITAGIGSDRNRESVIYAG
jgi:hypothetical protein